MKTLLLILLTTMSLYAQELSSSTYEEIGKHYWQMHQLMTENSTKAMQEDEQTTYSIGATYSQVTGQGVSYRIYDKSGYWQMVAIAVYSDNSVKASMGFSRGDYLYKRRQQPGSFSIPFAIKYHYGLSASNLFDESITGGAGIGMEFWNPHIKGVAFEFMVDYITGYQWGSESNDPLLNLSGSFAINFNF